MAAGAGAGLQDSASAAVRDAYNELKNRLKHIFGGNNDEAVQALDVDETDSAAWNARLSKWVTSTGADKDEQVLAAARKLLELTGTPIPSSKYHVDARGGRGVQIGDGTTQNNTFS
ncbi:hypothetical protein GCM10010168_44950 [Actinoplanes ianthinogenes]|nr:hypothetical protein GCM10010168_44950 [Actinoplanes ianthinogenes]